MLAQPNPPSNPVRLVGDEPRRLVVDVAEAAAMLGCSTWYVKKELDSGALRGFRQGRQWRIRVAEINAYLLRKEKERQPRIKMPERKQGKFTQENTPLLEGENDGTSEEG